MLNTQSKNIDSFFILNYYEIVYIPIVNPDGYEYSWTYDRLWRKNRSPNVLSTGGVSYGVDLNRNWNDHWSVSGSTNDPRSDVYHGPRVNSEFEVKILQNYYLSFKGRVSIALDVHSFSQYILWPWSWSSTSFKYEKQHSKLTDLMIKAIFNSTRTSFVGMKSSAMVSSNTLYQLFIQYYYIYFYYL